MKLEYYDYDYWYDRYYNQETPITMAEQGLGPISFEQYVVLFFTEEFPDNGNFFHPDFDKYLAVETAKCDSKLVEVLTKGIDQTLYQVKQMVLNNPESIYNIN